MSLKKEKLDELHARMDNLEIYEKDLIEKFILGSGKGGQKVNKTSSCVYLKHVPTGIEIKCQQDRSREKNRFFARRELCDRIESLIHDSVSKKEQEAAKIRRQKKRRTRKQQQKVLEGKKQRGDTEKLRRPPSCEKE